MDASRNIPTKGDNKSKAEAYGEQRNLLDKNDFAKDELVALCSTRSGRSPRQSRVLGYLTSREDEPFQEERVEVSVDHSVHLTFSENCKRMFEAAKLGDFKTLSVLLTNNATKFDAIDRDRNTLLHCAVISACYKGDTSDSFYNCIDLLMNCQQMKVNTPNREGYTAIGLAVHHLHKTCVERMLKHSLAHRLYLDYYPGDRESTVREIIMKTYPDLQPLLPAPLMESLDSSERDRKLLAALQHDEYSTFRENLDPTNPNPLYDEPYHSTLLEIACQMKDRKEFVEFLFESDADPNIKNPVTGMPLLHATARSGNLYILEILLKKEVINVSFRDNEDRTILHWWARVSERKPGDKQMLENCFKPLMGKYSASKMSVDLRDISDNTALYTAVASGFRDRAKLLVVEGADVMVFEHGSKILLPASLSIVEEILDACLENNGKPSTSKDLELSLKYQLLMKIVPRMAESQHHRDLLRHPVMTTFLTLKWQNVRFIFILDIVFYVSFVLFLTAYILCSEPYNTPNDRGVARNTSGPFRFNNSSIMSGINDSNFISQTNGSSLRFLQYTLAILLFLLTLREIHQLIMHRLVYIMSLENWLEILLIIATLISCYRVVESTVMKLHFSAVALLLGWFELLLMLGRLPQLSEQMEMLKTVSWTFLRFMVGYVVLLIAFALSFYILFKGSLEQDGAEMFANPLLSLLKTIVMFTGEFEASDLSFDTLPGTSHVIFVLFVVMEAIVLLNLLNGLAVNDTEKIRKDAETLSLVARAKLISRIEGLVSAFPKCLKPKVLTDEMFVIHPNKKNKIGSTVVRSLLNKISKETKPNKKQQSTESQENWSVFTEKLSALEEKLDSKLDKTNQILMQIQARLEIRERETTHL